MKLLSYLEDINPEKYKTRKPKSISVHGDLGAIKKLVSKTSGKNYFMKELRLDLAFKEYCGYRILDMMSDYFNYVRIPNVYRLNYSFGKFSIVTSSFKTGISLAEFLYKKKTRDEKKFFRFAYGLLYSVPFSVIGNVDGHDENIIKKQGTSNFYVIDMENCFKDLDIDDNYSTHHLGTLLRDLEVGAHEGNILLTRDWRKDSKVKYMINYFKKWKAFLFNNRKLQKCVYDTYSLFLFKVREGDGDEKTEEAVKLLYKRLTNVLNDNIAHTREKIEKILAILEKK